MTIIDKPTLSITHDHHARTTSIVRELQGHRIGTVATLPGIAKPGKGQTKVKPSVCYDKYVRQVGNFSQRRCRRSTALP